MRGPAAISAPVSPPVAAASRASTKIDTIGPDLVPSVWLPWRESWAIETKASALRWVRGHRFWLGRVGNWSARWDERLFEGPSVDAGELPPEFVGGLIEGRLDRQEPVPVDRLVRCVG